MGTSRPSFAQRAARYVLILPARRCMSAFPATSRNDKQQPPIQALAAMANPNCLDTGIGCAIDEEVVP